MRIPWYVTALGAAVVWGIHYPLVDHALRRVSLVSVLLLTAVPMVLVGILAHRQIAADLAFVRSAALAEQAPLWALMLTSLAGTVLLFLSIGGKNATLASLIEISYPVFVALFAYVLFRQMHLTPSVVLGAALVFLGVGIIIWHQPR